MTVLFLADVRVDWNTFHRSTATSEGPRTIVTEGPDISEAIALRSYAHTAPISANAILAKLASSIPDRELLLLSVSFSPKTYI